MVTLTPIQVEHGRRAARSGPRIPRFVWPLAVIIVLVPVIVYLIVSLFA